MPNRPPATGAILLLLVLGAPAAEAQTYPEMTFGFSSFSLQPREGQLERLDGTFLAGRIAWNSPWSLVGEARNETGTDANGVRLRMWSFLVGPRYTLDLTPSLDAFGHVLAGDARLSASYIFGYADRSSLDLSPGLGLDWHPKPSWVVRFEANEVFTRFVDQYQRNFNLSLGLGYRWGTPARASATPAPAPAESPLPPTPQPQEPAAAAPPTEMPPTEAAPATEGGAAAAETEPAPAPEPRVLYEALVSFGPGVWRLGEAGRQVILQVAQGVKGHPGTWTVAVTGHASRIGRGNQLLSERRARSVVEALVAAGVPPGSITQRGASYREPCAPNDTIANRAFNRRVEIDLKVDPQTPVETRKIKMKPFQQAKPN